MKRMWRVITTIVLVVALIGILGVAVGFMTGADSSRILQTVGRNEGLINNIIYFFSNFGLYWDWAVESVTRIVSSLF